MLKERLLRAIFKRYFVWRLDEVGKPQQFVRLEYPVSPEPRYGYGKPAHPELQQLFERDRASYAELLAGLQRFRDNLVGIAADAAGPRGNEPVWNNDYFPPLDAMALYGFLCDRKPNIYLEVGSGNSTAFARRAIRDHALGTKIVSIDPHPRAEIDALCDSVVRKPFEQIDPCVLNDLGSGDILFIDSSHRSFTNSDVTVFFLETLPRLKPGILLHIHDIFLPYDYPPEWRGRYYSEQYLLACYLLADHCGTSRPSIILPNVFVSRDPALSALASKIWTGTPLEPLFARLFPRFGGDLGVSLWLLTA